ncbi:MAG: transporter substrate-binding domain-containing protein [Acidobacteriia bacterium]|nr:transporter substrate-binding domain-containing protein [Terriglobia bacterium]
MKLRGTTLSRLALTALAAFVFSIPAHALKVCADPNFLPYSNQAGGGFENKIATAVAKWLSEPLEYTWASYRGHGGFPQFLSSTLDAKKCDAVMSIPYGSREELTTRPYYISSYVFVFPKSKNYAIESMNSPVLKQLKIGLERDTPAEDGAKMRGLIPGSVTAFDVSEDSGESPRAMLDALKSGQIDVLITWQPVVSAFLRNYPEFEVVAVPNTRALGAPEQYSFPMSMGVREGDMSLKQRLDDVIQKHQAELTEILSESGVKLYAPAERVP